MKYIVQIDKIEWIDETIKEADVSFTLNGIKLKAFSHPCDLKEGEKVEVEFDYIDDEISFDAIFNGNESMLKEFRQKKSNSWSYEIYGQIKQIEPLVLDCGKFDFQIDLSVKDESVIDSFIYISISRLDIMKI